MDKCLVTKLAVNLDGQDLPYLDKIVFHVKAGFNEYLNIGTTYGSGSVFTCEYVVDDDSDDIGFYSSEGTGYAGKKVSRTGDYFWLKASSTKDGYIYFYSKYDLERISTSSDIVPTFTFKELKYFKNLTQLSFNVGFKPNNKLEDLSNLIQLKTLGIRVSGYSVTGSLDDLFNLINLSTLSITWTNNCITGNVNTLLDVWASKGKVGNIKLALDGSRLVYNGAIITSNKTINISFHDGTWEEI